MSKSTPEINPFLSGLVIPTVYKTSKTATDGFLGYSFHCKQVETDKKCAIYQSNTQALLPLLSKNGAIVLLYLSTRLSWNQQKIEIEPSKSTLETGLSSASLYRGLEELRDLSVLVKAKRRNVYWINPAVLFCGDRLKTFPDNVLSEPAPTLKELLHKELFPEISSLEPDE